MRVYLEVNPPTLGQAIHRVANALRRYAPPEVEVVCDPAAAELQVYHALDARTDPHLYCDRFAMLQYQYHYATGADWPALWDRAVATFSYLDLPTDSGRPVPRFFRVPLGYDPAVFYPVQGLHRHYTVLATGYVSETEYIRECFEAAQRVGGSMAHVGHNFHWGATYAHHENLTDDQLRELYCRSNYVAAMRVVEGFELPALEALACGTPAIMLDIPCYRRWFGDSPNVSWVDPAGNIVEQLVAILRQPVRHTAEPLSHTWKTFATAVWRDIMANL